MPVPAPSTPPLNTIVDRLSWLLWTQFPVGILAFALDYAQRSSVDTTRRELMIGFGVFALVIYVYLTWQYHAWINALLSRPVRLTLAQAGRQLHGFMNVLLFFGTLGLLSMVLRLVVLPFVGELVSLQAGLALLLQVFGVACLVIGAAAAKAWFREGYITQTLKQRPRLLWSLSGYTLFTLVQLVVNVFTTVTNGPTGLGWVGVLMTLAANALFISGLLYTTRLVQMTFGAELRESLTGERLSG